MLKHYYQQELYKIRELAQEFAELYPMLAPLLGERGDPDVERLLEGFAFLVAQLQERIDKSMPRVYAGFAQMFYPQLLRPAPCATTIQFQPTANIGQAITVPQACQLQSVLIENQTCVFSTTQPLTVEPLVLTQSYADIDTNGHHYIALDFELMGVSLIANQHRSHRLQSRGCERSLPHSRCVASLSRGF
jgi:type VI secretion system protein ImpG